MKRTITLLTCAAVFTAAILPAKKTVAQGTLRDYQRAEAMNGLKENKILGAADGVKWTNGVLLYSTLTTRGKEFIKVDVQQKTKQPVYDPAELAAALTGAGRKTNAAELPFQEITLGDQEIKFTIGDSNWTYRLDTKQATAVKIPASARNAGPNRAWSEINTGQGERPVNSPDGKWVAFIRENNVYIRSAKNTQEQYQLSFDGSPGEYYASFISWSPDSRHLATAKIRPAKEHPVYLIESSPLDQLQPKLHTRNYLKPGDALQQRQPYVFSVESKRSYGANAVAIADQYNLTNPVWRKDSRAVSFEYNQRGHQQYKVMELDTKGATRDLIKEESATFIDYSGKRYRYDLADGKETIWASERDGWNHLYLYDDKGNVKNQITKGDWVVRRVVRVDETKRNLIFEASGKTTGIDPYFIQYYSINFDGTGLTELTHENGNHTAYFSPDYNYFVDVYSRIDAPPVTVLKNTADGKTIMELETADISNLLKTGWKLPEVFVSKARDGKTDIWGMIIRPSNFDPNKKYPVIEYIYAGPHSFFVPKSFVTDSRGSLHELAELGFIVVQCDGMGTNGRSKAFLDVCWKNLKDGGFPDRIAFMQSAAKKYPYMNLDKVGIFGNSAGGQSSMGALLFHPDFYKVAVSSSGCHDNRMDKIWWNEQWMGYPIGPQYAESSNVTHAANLKGKLLLILGEMDENVDPSSTKQLMNALIKANKNFDFIEIPGMGHSLGGDYGEHKRRDFFVKHLLGVDPPEWNWVQRITVPKP
ncbi:DPP IV N-terminal domain-containing protein [Sediminibacterium roseum]|nr:DPP IV N-terminal domain-containing protein [Sediminibacterium roseum]